MDFPRFVYKNKGPMERAGGTYSHLLTKSEEEHAAALTAGWYATLPEAIEPPKQAPGADDTGPKAFGGTRLEIAPPAEEIPVTAPEAHEPDLDAPPTREEMEIKARELGIKFDKRMGDRKLAHLIDKALEA